MLVFQSRVDPELHAQSGELAVEQQIGGPARDRIEVGNVDFPQVKLVAVGPGQLERLASGVQATLQRPIMGTISSHGMNGLPVPDVQYRNHAKRALKHVFLGTAHNPGS